MVEKNDSQESLELRSTNGQITFKFDSPEKKQELIDSLENMARKSDENKRKRNTCGACVAYPCFRYPEKEDPAGLCFQEIRRCRQECHNYICKSYPAAGGTCRLDNSQVKYEQECHIEGFKMGKK